MVRSERFHGNGVRVRSKHAYHEVVPRLREKQAVQPDLDLVVGRSPGRFESTHGRVVGRLSRVKPRLVDASAGSKLRRVRTRHEAHGAGRIALFVDDGFEALHVGEM